MILYFAIAYSLPIPYIWWRVQGSWAWWCMTERSNRYPSLYPKKEYTYPELHQWIGGFFMGAWISLIWPITMSIYFVMEHWPKDLKIGAKPQWVKDEEAEKYLTENSPVK